MIDGLSVLVGFVVGYMVRLIVFDTSRNDTNACLIYVKAAIAGSPSPHREFNARAAADERFGAQYKWSSRARIAAHEYISEMAALWRMGEGQ